MQRWKIWSSFLTVFAAGVIVGVVGLGLVLKLHFAPPKNPEEFHKMVRQRTLENLVDKVRPDEAAIPAIRKEINAVFDQLDALRDRNRPMVDGIVGQAEERIRAMLTPEQAQRFDKMMKERGHGPGLLAPPPPPPLP